MRVARELEGLRGSLRLGGGLDCASAAAACPTTAGNCINHPHDIDLSRVFGAGTESVPLPAHSHVIDDLQGGWWKTFVVGVTTQDGWDRIVAGKDLATVRKLQQEGLATGDIPSNLFIFFNVLPTPGS